MKRFLWRTTKVAACLVLAAFLLLASFFCLESVYPLKVARDVLTDGDRTLVVEGMSHVGTPRFYAEVRQSIAREKAGGAAYLYEGVRDDPALPPQTSTEPGHQSAEAEITSILVGGKVRQGVDISRLYKVLAKSAGLEVQPQVSFMSLAGGPDVNADMSAQELLGRLRASQARKAETTHEAVPSEVTTSGGVADLDVDRLEAALDDMGPHERSIMGFLVKGFMSSLVRLSGSVDVVPYSQDIDTARTQRLAQLVQARNEKHMVSTYGSRHLDGLLVELQRLDGRWRRVERTWREPFVQ